MGAPSTLGETPLLEVLQLGLRAYDEVLALQEARVEARHRGEVPDALIFCEHPPVVTVGRGGRVPLRTQRLGPFADAKGRGDVRGDLGARGIALREVARGGELTYHGPGQLVAYPVIELRPSERDLHRLLRDLEEVAIRALADFGLAAGRRAGHTGVWLGPRKLASLGIALRHWVTYHGVAINVDLDLAPYRLIRPCGLDPAVMTSMAREGARPATVAEVAGRFETHFRQVMDRP